MLTLPAWSRDLRKWQIDALQKYQKHPTPNFLVVATPGAGKTTFALRTAHSLLQSGQVTQIIIVCPTDHLKRQWANAASFVGVQIDPDHSNASATFKSGFHGIAVTYHQVASMPELFRFLSSHKRTQVILDEVHHAGENLSWGDCVRQAFEPCAYRLAMSGTPFRSDNNNIPFVSYKDGRSCADYSYTYADSLRDSVCRYVYFPKYEGVMEWATADGVIMQATFEDELNEREASARLNTAISAKGEWIRSVIRDAHKRLLDIRSGEHTNAGGLIIARDQRHAEQIAELVTGITGTAPVLAISDNPDASKQIDAYGKDTSCWIIAVKMISEGVDIPRLRVLVYATNVSSELFFRQAVGRIVRCVKGLEEQCSFFFIPHDRVLIAHAQAIKEEREHQLEEPDEYEDNGERLPVEKETHDPSYIPLSAEAKPHGAIFDQSEITQDEIDKAAQIARLHGYANIAPEAIVAMMRAMYASTTPPQPQEPAESAPRYREIQKLKGLIHRRVGEYAAMTGLTYNAIHTMWLKIGGKPHSAGDLEDLKRKHQWILERIKNSR
jgi:superfamily II DNA or RNA helicase